jgi:hypothetical protein
LRVLGIGQIARASDSAGTRAAPNGRDKNGSRARRLDCDGLQALLALAIVGAIA